MVDYENKIAQPINGCEIYGSEIYEQTLCEIYEQTFHESAPIYQNALRHSNFDHKLDYMKQAPQKTRRNRQRNIIWFNPPFSKNVKTNIARNSLCLIDKHFPPNYTRFSTETQSRSVIAA